MADGAEALTDGLMLARLYAAAPDSVSFRKLRKRLLQNVREAIDRYGMDATVDGRGGRWLVCLSGGKDSHALLILLLDLKAQGLLNADLLACNLDQGQPGFPPDILPAYFERLGVAHRIERRDTYSVVTGKIPEGRTYCSLCSRLRRGHLYRIAREEGCSSVVLGHHRDDALETFLMNLFHGGRLAAMPPRLLNEEGDLTLARPLYLCAEDDLAAFADALKVPIIPCDLCGSQDGLERQAMKRLLDQWERERPGRRETMFRALKTVRPSQLADPTLFDFAGLAPRRDGEQGGGRGVNGALTDAP